MLKKWLNAQDRAMASLLHELASAKSEAWCFFYTTLPFETKNGKIEFMIEDQNLIAVIDQREMAVLEPPRG
jgi:hypothetical protein